MGHLALIGTNNKHFKDPGLGGGGMGHLALIGTNDKHFRDHGFDTVPYCPLEKWSKCMTGKCFPEMKLETSIRNE